MEVQIRNCKREERGRDIKRKERKVQREKEKFYLCVKCGNLDSDCQSLGDLESVVPLLDSRVLSHGSMCDL